MRFFLFLLCCFPLFACQAKALSREKALSEQRILSEQEARSIIQDYEPFLREALLQEYEAQKIQKDSKSGLVFIDFCQYPPDRSLPFGALENGRFHGNKIGDLPFPCDKSSGAKKYFIPNANIETSYKMIQAQPFGALLPQTMPRDNTAITRDKGTMVVVWQHNGSTIRLWILYRDMFLDSSCTIIFAIQGARTSVFVQYRNMQ